MLITQAGGSQLTLTGNAWTDEGTDTNPLFVSPVIPVDTQTNRIITSDQPLFIRSEFTCTGLLNLFLDPGDNWTCSVYVEQMGGGEYSGGPFDRIVPCVGGKMSDTYNPSDTTVTIPAGSLTPGVYRLVFTLRLTANSMAIPFGGFKDCGLVHVIQSA